jgi:hypothetical protein
MEELNSLAEDHYQKTLLRRKGFLPWRKLVRMAKENENRAVEHHSYTILR